MPTWFTPTMRSTCILGNGAGEFTDGPVTLTRGAFRARVADFDRDGRADILVQVAGFQVTSGIELFHGNGNGTFVRGIRLVGEWNDFETGDVDRNGMPDIMATSRDGRHRVPRRRPGRPEGDQSDRARRGALWLRRRRFTGDGVLDLAVVDGFTYSWSASPSSSSLFSVLRGRGDGTFEPIGQYRDHAGQLRPTSTRFTTCSSAT